MSSIDLGPNLRLLCSYGRSISAICRQARINRHQLQRYLNGSAAPSLHTLRRICDFFGVEEHEILLPQRDFAALIKIRPPQLARSRDRISEYMAGFIEAQDMSLAARYVGYYHGYFQPNRQVPEVQRVLIRIAMEDNCLVTRTFEFYRSGTAGLPKVVKYEGIAYPSRSTLTMIERRPHETSSTFFTILYGASEGELTYMSGLVLGVAPDTSRDIYALRTCWRYLGREIDLRAALRACGQHPRDSADIGSYVLYCTQNELNPGEEYFAPHL
ncbi:MAG TPA: helix-turn-helix transcriptional regulator [Tabrizicola sp.]|nr:helix-turn-helix transcriptional regulator [Tabrizicola sp.]